MRHFNCPYRNEAIIKFAAETVRGTNKVTAVVTHLKRSLGSSTIFKTDVELPPEKHNDNKAIVDALAEAFIMEHGKSLGHREYERYMEFQHEGSSKEFEETLFQIVPSIIIQAGVWHPKIIGAFMYHTLGRDKFHLLMKAYNSQSFKGVVESLLSLVNVRNVEVSKEADTSATLSGSSMLEKSSIFKKKGSSDSKAATVEKTKIYKLDNSFEVEDLYGDSKAFTISSEGKCVGNIQCSAAIEGFARDVIMYHGKGKEVLVPYDGKLIRVINHYNFMSTHAANEVEEGFISEVVRRIRRSGIRSILVEVQESSRMSVNDSIKLFERCGFELIFDERCPRIQEDRVVLMAYKM